MAFLHQKANSSGWASFVASSIAGLLLAFFVFAMLAMGECLPRDGSKLMHACDVTKEREFWLFPALVMFMMAIATWVQFNARRLSHAIALTCGLTGAIALWLVEALLT